MPSSKKPVVNPTYQSLELRDIDASRSQEYIAEANVISQLQRPKGKFKRIAWNAFFLTFPMLLLTGVLFAFVFGYQIDQSGDQPLMQLRGNDSSSLKDDAFYVDLDSTFLIFLASWMSSLAPMLASFAMALAAYPVATKLVEDTAHKNQERLLTPFQLHLTLRLINGSTWSAIWHLMRYRLSWGKRVKGQGAALISLFRVTLAVVALSLLVFAADTWLHMVTKTVSIDKLSVTPNQDVLYSLFQLSPNCTTTNNTLAAQSEAGLVCTLDTGTTLLQSGTETLQTLNNQSNLVSVFSDGPDPTLAYLTINPSERDQKYDFSARTYGMRTSCRPITKSCNMTIDKELTAWNCSNGAFAQSPSNAALQNVVQSFYNDEAMTQSSISGTSSNPSYFALASQVGISANPTTNIAKDSEIVSGSNTLAAILLCSTTFFDVFYDVVQGNVTYMSPLVSNASVANIFIPALANTVFGQPNLINAFNMAAAVATTAQDLADQFALAYSKVALSVGAGSFIRQPALVAQTRTPTLVAKVPKAPLFFLVIINLIFIILGIVLALVAARTSPEAYEVQSRFSIAGIVAATFEKDTITSAAGDGHVAGHVEKLYSEYYEGEATKRVGVGRGQDGGFEFKALEKELYIGEA